MGKPLNEIFDLRSIKLSLEGTTKESVFSELIDTITALHPECNHAELLTAITEREAKMSTGISNGVAIPHAYCGGIGSMAGSIGISRQGIEYGALDNNPVNVVFLLAISSKADESQLHVLNLICKLAQSEDLASIKNAKSTQEIHDILSQIR